MGPMLQNRIKYHLHSVPFGLEFLNSTCFPRTESCHLCMQWHFRIKESQIRVWTPQIMIFSSKYKVSNIWHWSFETDLIIDECTDKIAPVWFLICSVGRNLFLIHVYKNTAILKLGLVACCHLAQLSNVRPQERQEMLQRLILNLHCHKLYGNLFYGRWQCIFPLQKKQFVRTGACIFWILISTAKNPTLQ